MALTPERKLKKATLDCMRSPLFADMSGVLMLGTKTVDDRTPTACTDGRDERYGRAFVDMLPIKQLGFVVLHEAMHKLLRHLSIWYRLYKESPQLANMAADYVVNQMLVDRDPNGSVIEFPTRDGQRIGLLDARFKGMTVKQVYDILKKENPGGGKMSGAGSGSGQGDSGQGGPEGFDEHDWGGAQELSQEEKAELEREIDQAVRQGQITAQKMHGSGAGNLHRELQDLLAPKVDWRDLLREFVSSTCAGRDFSSWRRPSRRFLSEGIHMPSMVSERVKIVVIGSDTSGSIGAAEHARNISEADSILKSVHPEEIHVIYWDSRVAGHEVYDDSNRDSFVSTTKPVGGGGTDPTSMMHYLNKKGIKPDCIIQFTDGCIGDWGSNWNAPILWAIVGNYGRNINAPCGLTIHVED